MKTGRRKAGIARRLFLYIVAVVLGSSAIILLSNTLLLKPLYYRSIRGSMLSGINAITDIDFSVDKALWKAALDAQATGKSYEIIVAQDNGVIYSSSAKTGLAPWSDSNADGQAAPENTAPQSGPSSDSLPGGNGQPGDMQPWWNDLFLFWRPERSEWEQVGDDGVYMATIREPQSEIEMLVCVEDLDNGVKIALMQAVEPVNQSVRQANILLIGCTALSTAVAVVFVSRLSRRFTQPIRQIQNTVGELAALNFGNQCNVRTGDELQSLGEDVNRLGGELEQALRTLREQNIQLEKDIVAQRQFISNASHELRTPLALIKGYADEINAGYAKDAGQRDYYIEIIAEEADKMSRLLREKLELTRMESGRTELIYEKLSVNERIRNFLEKYDGFITENGLKVVTEFGDDTIGWFDAMRFEQVLANYISNAARYGDGEKRVQISTQVLDDIIRVSVLNSGCAIVEDQLDSIWEGFYKADEARTRVKDSYGLGLSVVKAIQIAAGRKYGVENVAGGVCFWFDVSKYS